MSLVYVLLFNARTENEGIHTLQIGDRNKVLMFADEDDATRFGLMLEAQDFPPVTIEKMEEEDIIEFCREANYDWENIESGQLAVPPESTVPKTNWDIDGNHQPTAETEKTEISESDMASAELERIRRQLEGLL
ncbi:MAG: DUF3110 domain-containing protein [Limnothrix sp. RL_2_0]|nr:DUF3110 domain-containing protein [Limnothrix sp. RL_2_0]